VTDLLSVFHLIRLSSSIRIAIWGKDHRVMVIAGLLWLVDFAAACYGKRFTRHRFRGGVSDLLILSHDKGCVFPDACACP
jgi:hypothetical protein